MCAESRYVDVYVGDSIMLTEFVMYLYVPTWCEINVIIIIIIIITCCRPPRIVDPHKAIL